MKKKAIVKITWSKSKYLPMAILGHANSKAMDKNDNFTTPKVTSAAMELAATKVELAYAERKNGQVAKDELLKAAGDLDVNLYDQADYVSDIADGDESIIHSAAFQSTSNKHSKAPRLESIVTGPLLTSAIGGNVNVVSNIVIGAKMYIFIMVVGGPFNVTILPNGQIIVPAGTVAQIISDTKHMVTFNSLEGKNDVFVAVMTKNASGYSNLSPVSCTQTIS